MAGSAAAARHDNGWEAYFGAAGEIVFQAEGQGTMFVYRVKDDGSGLEKLIEMSNIFRLVRRLEGSS